MKLSSCLEFTQVMNQFVSGVRTSNEPKFVRTNSRKEETNRVIEKRRYETKRASNGYIVSTATAI